MKKTLALVYGFCIAALSLNAQNTADGSETFHVLLSKGTDVAQYLTQLHMAQLAGRQSAASRSLVHELTGFRHDTWNNPQSAWDFSDSTNAFYNAQAIVDSETELDYISGAWLNYENISISSNGQGQYLLATIQEWVNYLSEWRNAGHYEFTYNGDGTISNTLVQIWDTVNNVYINDNMSTNTYISGHKTDSVYETWNTGTMNWVNVSQNTFTYDGSGNMLSKINQQWSSGAWVNHLQFLYAYDSQNNRTQEIDQTWNTGTMNWDNTNLYHYIINGSNLMIQQYDSAWSGTAWDPADFYTYTYNGAGKQLTLVQQIWQITAFVNSYQVQNTYDGSNNQTMFEDYQWNTGTSSWTPYTSKSYTYDAYNDLTYQLNKSYNSGNQTLENTDQYFSYFQAFNSTGIAEVANQLDATIYPNPASGSEAFLNLQLTLTGQVDLKIYDAQGKLLSYKTHATTAGQNEIPIGSNNLSSGFYLVQVYELNSGKSSVLKFIKE